MTDRQPGTDTRELAAPLAAGGITLRPCSADDLPFLHRVYASTRSDELAPMNWSAEQTAAFLTMQFNAQHAYYQQHYPRAAFQIIQRHEQPVGRLYLDHRLDELRIVDIALLPQHRCHGVGTALLDAILRHALGLRLPVRIHVEIFNPALRLYTRLGFKQIEDEGVYYLMEKAPHA